MSLFFYLCKRRKRRSSKLVVYDPIAEAVQAQLQRRLRSWCEWLTQAKWKMLECCWVWRAPVTLPQFQKQFETRNGLSWVLPLELPVLLSAVQVDSGARVCQAVVGFDVGRSIVRVVVDHDARRRGAGLA